MKTRVFLALAMALSLFTYATAQDRSVVLSYMTDTAPEIDGDISDGEWDAAGPWITVTENSPNARAATGLIEGDDWGGDEDLSFRFKTMWQEETANFFVVYEIFDDIAMDSDPTYLWERDQVEMFLDGTNIEGDEDINSYHWWDNVETYGKLGVSRNNTFEGNGVRMTDDVSVWDEGFNSDVVSVSAVKDLETNADYRIEMAISLLPMIDDVEFEPFFGTQTFDSGHIVADVTQMKFTAAVADDDNFMGDDTERSNVITYYREIDGEETPWDQSTGFADLMFTGEFDGTLIPEPVAGDCNGDGVLSAADLDACGTSDLLNESLAAQGVLAGDFDANGAVEFADFLILSSNFGQSGDYSAGNADGTGNIEFADFLILSSNFGQSVGAAAAVPEPSSALLICLGVCAVASQRRRRS